ncbi:MAG TPA: TolC family protein [Fimbriimonadaceae bacterium]|nr:TolC family protein [Fimbriimonadaceae bacterium]
MPIWFGLAIFGVAQAQTGPLSVDQAVQIALQNGYSVLIAQTRVARQGAAVNEAAGHLGPQINLGGSYTRFDREGTADFGGQTVVTSPIDTKSASVSASVPIDINGSLHHQLGAAKSNYRASVENLAAAGNDIKLNARNAFFAVLRAQKLVDVQQQALKDAQEQLKNSQLLEQNGVAAHVDTLRVQSQVQQSQSDLIAAQNALAIANANFNAVLARPIDTPVDLVDVAALPDKPGDEGKLRDQAHAQRPEAKALLETRKALAEIRKAAETGNLPTLSFAVNYNRSFNTGAFAQPYTLGGTLTLGFPIFDSGITSARVKEAKQDENQAKLQYDQELESISQEVRQAVANMLNASERLDSATKQVQYTEENLRLARIRYQAGEGILLQVTDAETLLTQARNQEVAARYDYLTAYAQLQHALGVDDVKAAESAEASTTTKGN